MLAAQPRRTGGGGSVGPLALDLKHKVLQRRAYSFLIVDLKYCLAIREASRRFCCEASSMLLGT